MKLLIVELQPSGYTFAVNNTKELREQAPALAAKWGAETARVSEWWEGEVGRGTRNHGYDWIRETPYEMRL